MRPRSGRSRRRIGTGIAILIVGALLGWIAGGALSSSSAPALQATDTVGSAGAQAAAPNFPQTPAGAAGAVADFERAFASPKILAPGALRKAIETVATPDYVDRMLAANTPGRDRLAEGPIGAGLASGTQTLYSAVPIGYRIESFSPQRARVLTWGFTLLGNASAVQPEAYFGLTHTEVVWTEAGWRIAETKAGFGPTPKLATAPGPLGGYEVIDLASHLQSYELAP
jgi:hypothetical protein